VTLCDNVLIFSLCVLLAYDFLPSAFSQCWTTSVRLHLSRAMQDMQDIFDIFENIMIFSNPACPQKLWLAVKPIISRAQGQNSESYTTKPRKMHKVNGFHKHWFNATYKTTSCLPVGSDTQIIHGVGKEEFFTGWEFSGG